MLGGKVLHDQRKMFIAYLSAALLIVLLITAVMYANTTALVRRQHRESAQETARAQQRLLDRVFLELIMIAQQVEGDAELSDYYVSSAGYGAYQGMTSLRRYLVTNDYLLDVGLLFSDGHLLTAQGSYSLAGYADRFNLPQIQQVYDTWVSERGQTRYRLYAAPQGRALIVAFTQPLIGNPKTRQIVFTLSEKQIDSLFAAAMQDAGSDLALYDREGTLLYHYRDGEPPLADDPSLTVSTETSTVLSLRYAYWYDAQRINDSFSTLNRRFLALLTLAVLAAIALSVVMSVINFRPVRRLLALVPGESLEQVARLDELQDYLAGVMARNLRQAQQLQSYTALTRNYALEQVLLGRGGEEQLRGLLQSGNIAFSFGYYTVFRFLPPSAPRTARSPISHPPALRRSRAFARRRSPSVSPPGWNGTMRRWCCCCAIRGRPSIRRRCLSPSARPCSPSQPSVAAAATRSAAWKPRSIRSTRPSRPASWRTSACVPLWTHRATKRQCSAIRRCICPWSRRWWTRCAPTTAR